MALYFQTNTFDMKRNPPLTLDELQLRIDLMSGLTLGEIASELNIQVPENLQVEKGWSGQLIEAYLGTSAGNLSEPDFLELGIELKSIPIDTEGKVLESTFVSVAPLKPEPGIVWRKSSVYKKLRHVLWVPIIASREIPVPLRQIATPFIWQMPTDAEKALEQDWQELVEMIAFGQYSQITAKHGEYLQLRPKAANGSIRTQGFDEQGNPVMAQPKGFYLRTRFTQQIINEQFQL